MDLKQTFIQRALAEYNRDVIALMRRTMVAKKVGVTGEGEKSLAYEVLQSGAGAESKISFKEYLRFVDMGVGRGHPLGGLKAVRVELASRKGGGKVFKKDDTFKPKKIYAKVAYSRLGSLYGQLLYGYTQEAIDTLKAELQQQPNTEII